METIVPIAIVLIIGACCHHHNKKRKLAHNAEGFIAAPAGHIETVLPMHQAIPVHVPPMHVPPMHVPPVHIPPIEQHMMAPPMHVPQVPFGHNIPQHSIPIDVHVPAFN